MQWQSWIHIQDLVRIFIYVLNKNMEGVYNAVSPKSVTNNEFIETTARVLKRPLFLPKTPKFVMKLILGEMHVLLFESQHVSCKKIEDMGFSFKYNTLETALKNLIE